MTSAVLIRARAYAVHLLTANGIVAAFFAVAELLDDAPDERVVFAWLIVAVVIDAVDGPLARAWEVKRFAADIDVRTIGPSRTMKVVAVMIRPTLLAATMISVSLMRIERCFREWPMLVAAR